MWGFAVGNSVRRTRAALPGPRSRVVLIVDDDPIVREALARGLDGDTYTTVHAESALAALELMRSVQVDAVIADFEMPVMNGGRFLAYVRDMFPHCARLMMSGRRRSSHEALRETGLEPGFVLEKSIAPEELRRLLALALAR